MIITFSFTTISVFLIDNIEIAKPKINNKSRIAPPLRTSFNGKKKIDEIRNMKINILLNFLNMYNIKDYNKQNIKE